ncbi:retrovirus-related Pol polyprotein from transposon TNT 1-94 [Trichonephila clavipes]|nr:retrovirus-related Pol polyprotein from transposon TNT 1-94 [Trichonephila clavipes]
MKAALSLKSLDSLIINEKPGDLSRKEESEWESKNLDAVSYIKLSLADEQALQFAVEDNAKVWWDKIRATFIGRGEDRKMEAGNELKNILMKNGETVTDYIARERGGGSYLSEIENETWDIDSFFEVSPERNEIDQNTENGVSSNFEINNGPVAIQKDNSIPLQTTSSHQTSRMQLPVLELNDVQNQILVKRSERLKSKQMSVHLTDNLPNSYFEAKNSANWQNWKLAMEYELDSLDKHKVREIVQKPTKSK